MTRADALRARRAKFTRRAEDIVPDAMRAAWRPSHRDLVELWIGIGHSLGYLVTVTHDSRREHWGADSGWPDIFAADGTGRAWAIEIKVPPDDATDEQRAWLVRLDTVPGIFAGIWRSSGDRVRDAVSVTEILRAPPRTLPRPDRKRPAPGGSGP
jgi:hypothetical protein